MISEKQIVNILRTEVKKAAGIRKWAETANVPYSTISSILSGKMKMRPSVAVALGYEKVKGWVKRAENPKPAMQYVKYDDN